MMMSLFKSRAVLTQIKTSLLRADSFYTHSKKLPLGSVVPPLMSSSLFKPVKNSFLQANSFYTHLKKPTLDRIAQFFGIQCSDIRFAAINPNDHLNLELSRGVVSQDKIKVLLAHAAESNGDIEYYHHTYATADVLHIVIYDESVDEFLKLIDGQPYVDPGFKP